MKESVKFARLELGELALQALYAASDAADPIKIPELFEPDTDSDHDIVLQSRNRKWQQHMMAQLKAAGVVDGDEGTGFNTVDRKRLQEIIANLDVDKVLLANLIFTSEASGPDLPSAMVPAPDSPLDRMADTMVGLVSAIENNHKSFRSILDQILAVTIEVAGADVSASVEKLEERFSRTNSRIDKLEARVGDVLRVSEAMQTTLKTIAGSLGELGGALKTITEAASGMAAASSALARVSQQISEAEQDKFGRLVRSLKAHLDEGKLLHEAALELAAKAS